MGSLECRAEGKEIVRLVYIDPAETWARIGASSTITPAVKTARTVSWRLHTEVEAIPAGMNDVHRMNREHDDCFLFRKFLRCLHAQFQLFRAFDDVIQYMVNRVGMHVRSARNDPANLAPVPTKKCRRGGFVHKSRIIGKNASADRDHKNEDTPTNSVFVSRL